MNDLNKITDYIFEIVNNRQPYDNDFITDFKCETVFSGDETDDNHTIYLITGKSFMPFLISNNKIYKIPIQKLNKYCENVSHKCFCQIVRDETEIKLKNHS